MESFSEEDVRFKMPGGMIIAGPSSSGKSTLLMRILDNYKEIFEPEPAMILYAYGQFNDHVNELSGKGIAIHPGLPSGDTLDKCRKPLLLVLDDLMLSASESYLSEVHEAESP